MSRLKQTGLRFALVMVCLPPLAVTSPPLASAHTTTTHYSTYVTVIDCTESYSFFGHSPYYYVGTRATTVQSYSIYFGPNGELCYRERYTGANQLKVHPVTYKNGDGRGGYEVMYNWGVFGSPCCYVTYQVYWNTWLSDYWGPGWYSMDQGSASYIRNEDAMRGGWRYAVWVEWMPSPQ